MSTIFISYSRQSETIVTTLADDIEALGHTVWFDQELSGGQAWWDQILEQVRGCDVFVFALAPEALDSTACMREYQYAADLGKPILPVLVAQGVSTNLLPAPLSAIQYVDYRKQDRDAAFRLARAISSVPSPKPLPDPLPPSPEVPISYLVGLAGKVESASTLSLEDQRSLVFDLRRSLRESENAGDARILLEKLRKRRDLLADIRDEVDEILAGTTRDHPPARTPQPKGHVTPKVPKPSGDVGPRPTAPHRSKEQGKKPTFFDRLQGSKSSILIFPSVFVGLLATALAAYFYFLSPATTALPKAAISANPTGIQEGESSTLTWEAIDASVISIEPGVGSVGPSGARQVSPKISTTYTITARGDGGEASDSARVTVAQPAPVEKPPIPTIEISATPSEIKKGNTSVLKWAVKNATNVVIEPGIGAVTSTGIKQVRPTSSTTYAIVARGKGGSAKDSAQIAVVVEQTLPPLSDDVVVDSRTGLLWTRKDNGKGIDWPSANRYCEGLTLAGYSDWRLPTIDELEALHDQSVDARYKIRSPFVLTACCPWSSKEEGSDSAWGFNFYDGVRSLLRLDYAFSYYRALCVRGSGD